MFNMRKKKTRLTVGHRELINIKKSKEAVQQSTNYYYKTYQ